MEPACDCLRGERCSHPSIDRPGQIADGLRYRAADELAEDRVERLDHLFAAVLDLVAYHIAQDRRDRGNQRIRVTGARIQRSELSLQLRDARPFRRRHEAPEKLQIIRLDRLIGRRALKIRFGVRQVARLREILRPYVLRRKLRCLHKCLTTGTSTWLAQVFQQIGQRAARLDVLPQLDEQLAQRAAIGLVIGQALGDLAQLLAELGIGFAQLLAQ